MTFHLFSHPASLKSVVFVLFMLFTLGTLAQDDPLKKLTVNAAKGDYLILEVRMNNEDEFRTIEGHTAGLSRIAIFTGNNKDKEIISKDFGGFNQVIQLLNQLKSMKWKVVDVYNIKGQSLIITHYLMKKAK